MKSLTIGSVSDGGRTGLLASISREATEECHLCFARFALTSMFCVSPGRLSNCTHPLVPEHGGFRCSPSPCQGFPQKSSIHFFCEPGYHINNKVTASRCRHGRWIPPIPTCIPIKGKRCRHFLPIRGGHFCGQWSQREAGSVWIGQWSDGALRVLVCKCSGAVQKALARSQRPAEVEPNKAKRLGPQFESSHVTKIPSSARHHRIPLWSPQFIFYEWLISVSRPISHFMTLDDFSSYLFWMFGQHFLAVAEFASWREFPYWKYRLWLIPDMNSSLSV